MPVRIYDIAKKLGIESKAVLVKAKELGIAGARVPSSSLDKITAEYLELQIAATLPPKPLESDTAHAPVPAAEPPPPPAHPAEPPIIIVSAPAEPSAAEATTTAVPPPPAPCSPATPELEPLPEAVPTAAVEVHPLVVPLAPTPAPVPEPPPAPAPAPVLPAEPPAPSPVQETMPEPVQAPAPAFIEPSPSEPLPPVEPVPPAPPAVPPPPLPPPVPAAPALGSKVGFIQLPGKSLPRVGEKIGQVKLPAKTGRGEPPKGQPSGRPGAPATRPAPFGGGKSATAHGLRGGDSQRKPGSDRPVLPENAEIITLKPPIIVRELAEKMRVKPFKLIADLMELGVFASVNQPVEESVAVRAAAKNGFRLEAEKRKSGAALVTAQTVKRTRDDYDAEDKSEMLKPRAPVVTIMGHVDHGKTTLLDVIRKSDVAAGEAGGITQHIGAYTISFPHPDDKKRLQQITFLDTPGHAAFSAMRARGANVTDLVVLVVAANDGVMPQTIEALNHAQAAKVPILVAVNKVDHPTANPLKVRQQLQDKGLVPDEWGGDTIFVDCSALTKQGVDKLLEMILLQADLLELKANPNRRAKGNVVESGKEPGGPVATVLVRKGTLRLGDAVLCGKCYGKVRALINEDGNRLKEAGPSHAVKLLGLNEVPEAGIEFAAVENLESAREEAERRAQAEKTLGQEDAGPDRRSIDEWLRRSAGETDEKVLRTVVKADTQGSVEAIVSEVKKIESDKVKLEVLHSAVGTITTNDVDLAAASRAIILGFHTRIDSGVADKAKRESVPIKLYAIIYELVDEVKDAMSGLLPPIIKETVTGAAEVRKVFALSKGGNVAGCVVSGGRIARGKVRVMRRRNLVYEGMTQTLRRFQDEVNEVRAGMECGIRIDGFDDFREGDVIESYAIEKVPQKI